MCLLVIRGLPLPHSRVVSAHSLLPESQFLWLQLYLSRSPPKKIHFKVHVSLRLKKLLKPGPRVTPPALIKCEWKPSNLIAHSLQKLQIFDSSFS